MSDVKIINYMENLVQDTMPAVLKHMNICRCDRCQMDILAYSLNHLTPKYVVTRKGELYTKLTSLQHQFEVDIVSAITQSATLISSNPRHD